MAGGVFPLEEQERMRRDFIANAAHELRTPLTNLQGYLEALRDGVIDRYPAPAQPKPLALRRALEMAPGENEIPLVLHDRRTADVGAGRRERRPLHRCHAK